MQISDPSLIDKPITALVFSKDRTMQLDATLRSFFLHCRDPHLAKINVLYLATTANMEKQYRILAHDYPQVHFLQQGSFRQNVLDILLHPTTKTFLQERYPFLFFFTNISAQNWKIQRVWRRFYADSISRLFYHSISLPEDHRFIFFLVDDNVFVRGFELGSMIASLQAKPEALGFSLRLGKNTTYAYVFEAEQNIPPMDTDINGHLFYNWPKSQFDFGYAFEVSSSIYRASEMVKMLAVIPLKNPNALEGEMSMRRKWFQNKFPILFCAEKSITFCNPINLVQTENTQSKVAHFHYYDIDQLARQFEQGERIQVMAYNNFTPQSCHEEVALHFYKPQTTGASQQSEYLL